MADNIYDELYRELMRIDRLADLEALLTEMSAAWKFDDLTSDADREHWVGCFAVVRDRGGTPDRIDRDPGVFPNVNFDKAISGLEKSSSATQSRGPRGEQT
jgi:hypothetical protein